jgi:subtilisin family serine protease
MSSSRLRFRDRRRHAGAVLAAVAALTAGLAGPAQAQQPATGPDPAAVAPTGAKSITLDGLAQGTHEITLISGDKVILTGVGHGRFRWRIEAATRPDGNVPVLHGESGPDGEFLIPDDALPAVASGALDRNLFNITYLAENGYTDADSGQVPVIAQYPESTQDGQVRAAATAMPASDPGVTLESINATGLAVTKADTGMFWQAVTGGSGEARALHSGMRKLWLDKKAHVNLSESVPLVGAPQAWAAGLDGAGVTVAVLDTGIDQTHPDLLDKVVASASFVSDTVADGHGHGTHVASTIAGSGAASDGRRTGVAPGADLAIGKVLSDGGSGSMSGVIDGMEWAAQQAGADIVSMSLSADLSDGTDPASQAVNALTASTGALFVIAAGNLGADQTVASPGAAEAALTVAATAKDDGLAGFSSRGPRLDGALKPDIAAPGVHIVAARAAGTSLCANVCVQPGDGPVDDRYTSASGTSMATPHVAGAAAILAQQHPDWSAARYKAALMSTSADAGHTAYEQGAGRLDVARAVGQRVHAVTAAVDYGLVPAGQPPASREVTYTNLGDQPVTLNLAASLRDTDGGGDLDVLTLPDSVTVPAGASETITVTADTARLDEGVYSGSVVATGGAGVRLSTPVGIVRDAPLVTVDIDVPHPPTSRVEDGDWRMLYGIIDVAGNRGSLANRIQVLGPGQARARIPRGTYDFTIVMTWTDADLRRNGAFLIDPELEITGDTTLTFDGRNAQELTFGSPDGPLESFPAGSSILMNLEQTVRPGEVWRSYVSAAAFYRLWATPTKPRTHGQLLFSANYALGHPEVQLEVTGPNPMTLHPVMDAHRGDVLPSLTDYRHFEGRQRLALVDVGHATREDIAGLDLRGKLVLIDNDRGCSMTTSQVHNVRDAGAAGILVWTSSPQNVTCGNGPIIPISVRPEVGEQDPTIGIPFTSISPGEARSLRDRLAQGPVTITVTGTPDSPYRYLTSIIETDGVPSSLHFPLSEQNMAQVDMEFHGAAGTTFQLDDSAFRLDQLSVVSVAPPQVHGPTTQTSYVGPVYDDALHLLTVSWPTGSELRPFLANQPSRTLMRWNTGAQTIGPFAPSADVLALYESAVPGTFQRFLPCVGCRHVDKLVPGFAMASGDGRAANSLLLSTTARLYRDGVEIPLGGPAGITFDLPKEEANYRLTVNEPGQSAEWTFRSATVTEQTSPGPYICMTEAFEGLVGPCRTEPLVYVAYDLGASQALDNTVSARGPHRFTVRAFHAPATRPMPAIAGLKLWTSVDGGQTWQPADVRRKHGGEGGSDRTLDVVARYPDSAQTGGTVSLKAEAWDADGNRVTQISHDAFRLR